MTIRVRTAEAADRPSVDAFLHDHNSDVVARGGELDDARLHPALLAETIEDGRLAGILTYILYAPECEILTPHAVVSWRGVGTALLGALESVARRTGCSRLRLITTNDNVDAIRFYQRRGFRLAAFHAGAVDEARERLKPSRPEVGAQGIPIRDEHLLEKGL